MKVQWYQHLLLHILQLSAAVSSLTFLRLDGLESEPELRVMTKVRTYWWIVHSSLQRFQNTLTNFFPWITIVRLIKPQHFDGPIR